MTQYNENDESFLHRRNTDEDVCDVLTEFASQNDGYVFWHVKEYDYYDADDKPELIAINNGLIALGCDPGEEVLIAI